MAKPRRAGAAQVARDDADAPVAAFQQVFHGAFRRLHVVRGHGGEIVEAEAGGVGRQHDGRQRDLAEAFGVHPPVAAEKQQPGGLFLAAQVQSALDGVLVFVDVVHGQRVAVRGERLLDAFDHLGKQLVRRAGHHGDDAAAVDLLEVLRVGIELISAFLRQRQNGAACLLADIRQAVQGAGDRADGVAGQAGKVFDRHMGYPLTAPAATPLMIYF